MTDDRRIGDELDWLEGLIRRAWNHAECLSDGDIRFIDGMAVRLDRYGPDTYVSPKQRGWLEAIAGRLDDAGAPADPADLGDAIARPTDEAMR